VVVKSEIHLTGLFFRKKNIALNGEARAPLALLIKTWKNKLLLSNKLDLVLIVILSEIQSWISCSIVSLVRISIVVTSPSLILLLLDQ